MLMSDIADIKIAVNAHIFPRPRNDFQCPNGRLHGCQDLCVCFIFGFQTWSPCKGIKIPSLPDVNKENILVQKMETF
jgi:hypothetical protein